MTSTFDLPTHTKRCPLQLPTSTLVTSQLFKKIKHGKNKMVKSKKAGDHL